MALVIQGGAEHSIGMMERKYRRNDQRSFSGDQRQVSDERQENPDQRPGHAGGYSLGLACVRQLRRNPMANESRTSRTLAGRAPDIRFKNGDAASDKLIAVKKIDITALQLDDSFDGDGDPYNNTGRHLMKKIRDRF